MIDDIFTYILKYIGTLELTFSWSDFLQISFLAVLLLLLYKKFIKNTSSEKFVKGILIIICVWFFSEFLLVINLKIIGMFLIGAILVGIFYLGYLQNSKAMENCTQNHDYDYCLVNL